MDQKRAIRQLATIKKYGKSMRLAAEEWDTEWQTLIAILLSARTRDEVTIEVCKELFGRYGSLKELADSSFDEVSKIIKPVNFYRNKTKSVINCSKVLIEKFNGNVPHDIEKLIELPGVGRKTANVFLSEYNHDAIGVDTHVAYCSHRLAWTKSTKPPIIEKDLEELFPKSYWSKINLYLVRFGKTYISRKKKNELLDEIKKIR